MPALALVFDPSRCAGAGTHALAAAQAYLITEPGPALVPELGMNLLCQTASQ